MDLLRPDWSLIESFTPDFVVSDEMPLKCPVLAVTVLFLVVFVGQTRACVLVITCCWQKHMTPTAHATSL